MNTMREDLGVITDCQAVLSQLPVAGLEVLDVGCGPGKIARELHAAGARVLGIEPDPLQAASNQQTETVDGLTFIEGRAERLPAENGSVDGIFFFRSLHHVPAENMGTALKDAARALRPNSGWLCVIEPGMEGTNFSLMRPFHDETRVRNEAQIALDRFAAPLFRRRARFRYVQFPRYAGFDAFVARVMGQTFNDIRRERVENDEVRRLFEAGRAETGDYVFEQPMLMDLFRGPIVD
jgi:SAM-dependent methyltransferase